MQYNSYMETNIYRGDIFLCDLGEINYFDNSSIQRGFRPVIILQNDIQNEKSPTTIVAPITSAKKKRMLTHVKLEKGEAGIQKESIILLEQVTTIDRFQLGRYLGSVDDEKLLKIERALMASLGLL